MTTRTEVQDWFESKDYPALGNASTWNGWLKAADAEGSTGGGTAASPIEDKNVTTTGTSGSAVTASPTEVKVADKTSADGTKVKTAEVTVSAR